MYLFYINIFISNIIPHEISFLLKYTLRFAIFKFDLNVKHRSYFFQIKTMIYKKKNFIETNMKKLLNYMLYTQDVTCNLSR